MQVKRVVLVACVVAAILAVVWIAASPPNDTEVLGITASVQDFCGKRPTHPRCETTTTTVAPTTTTAPTSTTTAAPTTTTTTAPTTTTTVAPTTTTTTLPPTTTTTVAPTTTTVPVTTTTAPPGACVGVQVAAGSNLVTVTNAQPAGTTFCLAAGTHTIAVPLVLQNGDKVIGAGNRASIVTGSDTTRQFMNCACTDVLIRNLVMERFASVVLEPNGQQGIFGGSFARVWVDNVESRNNWGTGVELQAGGRITNSYLHHNHWHGFVARGSDILVENTEISYSNWLGEHSWVWSAGGNKAMFGSNQIFRNNHSHHNCGPGLWVDNSESGNVMEGNNVHDNFGPGLMYEISKSAIIRNNRSERNALAVGSLCNNNQSGGGELGGILVSNSENVEVAGNVLVNNDGGVMLRDADRGTAQEHTRNLNIHDNDSTYTTGNTGCNSLGTTSTCASGNNKWVNNDYHVGSDTTPFLWAGAERTFAQWQGYGFDLTGSID